MPGKTLLSVGPGRVCSSDLVSTEISIDTTLRSEDSESESDDKKILINNYYRTLLD